MSGGSFVFGFGGRLVALALMVGVVAASAPTSGWAQSTSVEELERRLQKAKEERARRDAAATRARDEAEAERKRREADASRAESERKAQEARAESERKAQESRLSTLVVQADAPCRLSINGNEVALLSKGITELKVAPGQSIFSCASTEERVSFDGKVDARSGQNTVVQIDLTSKLAELRNSRAAAERERTLAAQRAAQDETERQARAAEAERSRRVNEARERERLRQVAEKAARDAEANAQFEELDQRSVRQRSTGLVWTKEAWGREMDWHAAKKHCESLGSTWALPTMAELQSLKAADGAGQVCGRSRAYGEPISCPIPPIINIKSSSYLWSSETYFEKFIHRRAKYLIPNGMQDSHSYADLEIGSVLCVRR